MAGQGVGLNERDFYIHVIYTYMKGGIEGRDGGKQEYRDGEKQREGRGKSKEGGKQAKTAGQNTRWGGDRVGGTQGGGETG